MQESGSGEKAAMPIMFMVAFSLRKKIIALHSILKMGTPISKRMGCQ